MVEVEKWAPVAGFEGLYEVSNFGKVRRIGKAARHGNGHGGGAGGDPPIPLDFFQPHAVH